MADRPNQCAHCNKRMSRKSWYYRNGQYFCKKRCFEAAKAKAASEGAKAQEKTAAEGKPAEPKPEEKPAAAAAAPKDE